MSADSQKTRTQSVTENLRELIVQGQLQPGDHVQEVHVAERLRVSRTPVRIALNTLASEGFLEYAPNRGYFVRRFDIAEILDVYEIRATLESLAAQRAAARGLSREQESDFMHWLALGDEILAKGFFLPEDLEPYRRMNVAIHEGISGIAGGERLAGAIQQTHNLPLASDRIILWQNFEVLKRSHDDHHRVIDAILARNTARAGAIMHEHVFYAGIALRDHLRQHGGLGSLIDPMNLAATVGGHSKGDLPP